MKTCRRCGENKPEADFPKNKAVPGGIDRMCKACWKHGRKSGKRFVGTNSAPLAPSLPPEGVDVEVLDSLSKLQKGVWYYASTSSVSEVVEAYRRKFGTDPTRVLEFRRTRYVETNLKIGGRR